MSKKTVFVGISGGVDSAVSAALLKEATPKNFKKLFGRPTPKGFRGYDVVGVFIRTWHPDFLPCSEEEERLDAMRICVHLDIPFLTFDFEDVYKKEVADYMIAEYKAGRTPNPDVMCNKEVKFGAFFKKAISMGADYIATGHYTRSAEENIFLKLPEARSLGLSRASLLTAKSRGQSEDFAGKSSRVEKRYVLLRGLDPTKDQSYFLWTLKQEQLAKILFPIGHLKKTEVRKLAQKFKLPVAEKKDSQGICFLGRVDLKNFLKHYIKEKKGEVVLIPGGERSDLKNSKRSDLKEPEIIGHHNGVLFYTLGERHGFTITKKNPNDGPYYVVGKDIKKNILYVSQDKTFSAKNFGNCAFKKGKNLKNSGAFLEAKKAGDQHDTLNFSNSCLILKNVNWIIKIPKIKKNYTCQIRYHGELLSCRVEITDKTKVKDPEQSRRTKVIFQKPILVASGQSCVIYDGDICLGGGIVE